jgi:hypothetical protein
MAAGMLAEPSVASTASTSPDFTLETGVLMVDIFTPSIVGCCCTSNVFLHGIPQRRAGRIHLH